MKNLINIILTTLLIFNFHFLFGQCLNLKCDGKTSIDISTGVDESGNYLPIGSVDPNWKLMNYPPLDPNGCTELPNVSIPDANVVSLREWPPNSGITSNWLNLNGCLFTEPCGLISSNTANTFPCDNLSEDQPWRFRNYFCVCKKSYINLTGAIRLDDIGSFNIYDQNDVLIHNVPVSNSYYSNVSINPSGIVLDLNPGSYYIEVEVLNTGGKVMGIVITGDLSVVNGGPSLVDANAKCCSSNGVITIQKIIETQKCNSIFENGEVLGSGWTFHLLDNLNNIIQTGITNNFGELSFSGLSSGTYTVVEEQQSGYSSTNSSQQAAIDGNGVALLTFFNCPISDNSVYCCDEENLIVNGNFESGYILPEQSDYVSAFPSWPSNYSVIDFNDENLICKDWNIEDHTHCINETNNKVLVVNGKTQQNLNIDNVIWQSLSPIEVAEENQYKFCAYIQHLNQCCFDVIPKIKVEIKHGTGSWVTLLNWDAISPSSAADPCDWEEINGTFTTSSNTVEIRILLDEMGIGDGNDLAIDDISLTKLQKLDLFITVDDKVPSNPLEVQASIFNLGNNDDVLPSGSCEYAWFIVRVEDYSPLILDWWEMLNNGWYGGSSLGHDWGLTTNFPNIELPGENLYRVYLNLYDCDCIEDIYVYQWSGGGNALRKKGYNNKEIRELKSSNRINEDEKIVAKYYIEELIKRGDPRPESPSRQ